MQYSLCVILSECLPLFIIRFLIVFYALRNRCFLLVSEFLVVCILSRTLILISINSYHAPFKVCLLGHLAPKKDIIALIKWVGNIMFPRILHSLRTLPFLSCLLLIYQFLCPSCFFWWTSWYVLFKCSPRQATTGLHQVKAMYAGYPWRYQPSILTCRFKYYPFFCCCFWPWYFHCP